MLEIVNQLDGFDARGNVKVGCASNCQRTTAGTTNVAECLQHADCLEAILNTTV